MATVINNYLWTTNNGVTTINLFNDLRTMPGVKQAVGDDNDMIFKIDEHVYLEFVNWDRTGTSSADARKIFVRYNDISTQIYSNTDAQFSPTSRMYQIVKSKNNDWTLQIGTEDFTRTSFSEVSAIFAVVNVRNTRTDEVGYGVYVPYNCKTFRNQYVLNAPKYLITEDVTQDIENKDQDTNRMLCYIITTAAKLTMLIPICAVSSDCISTSAYVMMIGQRPIYGDATLNNGKYYCIDGLCMLDQ